jgi:hypothetical protein
MNWEAIGAIGDMVGGFGVIITLIYLAMQVRQNTAAQKISSFQSLRENTVSLHDLCASDSDLADLFVAGVSDQKPLSEQESNRFHFLLMSFFRRLESIYILEKVGHLSESDWSGIKLSCIDVLNQPGTRRWWMENQQRFRKDFVSWTQEMFESVAG